MTEGVIQAVFAAVPKELGVFFISLLPIIELRGAIPVGIAMGMQWWVVYLLAVIGNMLPVPIILLFIRKLFDIFRDKKGIGKLIRWAESHSLKKKDQITKYSAWGLFLFVAIPLPGTGAWTGALIAALLEMDFKYAFFSILGGVLLAGVIVTLISTGVLSIFQFLL